MGFFSFVVITIAVASLNGIFSCLNDDDGSSLLLIYIADLGGVSEGVNGSINVHEWCINDELKWGE